MLGKLPLTFALMIFISNRCYSVSSTIIAHPHTHPTPTPHTQLGWTQLSKDGDTAVQKLARVALVMSWVLAILLTFITQILTCFRRDSVSALTTIVYNYRASM